MKNISYSTIVELYYKILTRQPLALDIYKCIRFKHVKVV